MIDIDSIRATLRRACKSETIELREGLGDEWYVMVPCAYLVTAIELLSQERQWHHLSAISAVREGPELKVLYHLWLGGGLTLGVCCPQDGGELPSLCKMLPIAAWYEREIHDMWGLAFAGHPDPRPLLLPDDWEGPPPMLGERSTS